MRKRRAEEGDPVEMVSTKFVNAAGKEVTVTGMLVRKNIHDSLVHCLMDHEHSLRMSLRAQGMRAVDAELRHIKDAGPVKAEAWQNAVDIFNGAQL
jgi:hypothetical protein